MTERRYDMDWLRVLAMLAVFVYHCTRFFDTEGWHLKNAEQSFVLFVLARGQALWRHTLPLWDERTEAFVKDGVNGKEAK